MNFFGHAVLALARRDDAAFVVGSMAPDFATMSGVRLAREVAHPSWRRGSASTTAATTPSTAPRASWSS
ncbi:MAG: hypothetical protein R3F62_28570 [Planctomycetota bacterium]